MIDLLAGVPKQLADLLTRLTATWAAKLDTLHDSRLTSARAGYLDKLNLSGKATDDTIYTTARAAQLDRVARPPIAMITPDNVIGYAIVNPDTAVVGQLCDSINNNGSHSYSGSGVLTLAMIHNASGALYSPTVTITIDGTTVISRALTLASGTSANLVGCGSGGNIAFEQVHFKTSIAISFSGGSSASVIVYFRYWKAS